MTTSSLFLRAALLPSILGFALLPACGGSTLNPLGDAGGPGTTEDDAATQPGTTGSGAGATTSMAGPTEPTGSDYGADADVSTIGTSPGSGSGGSTTTPTTGFEDDAGDNGCGPVYCAPDGGPCATSCALDASLPDTDASAGECMSYCAAGSCGMSDGCFGICGCAPGETCSADGTCS
jgi:hypothetical protein